MIKQIHLWVNQCWYQKRQWLWPLSPLAHLYKLIIACRRKLYQTDIFKVHRLPVPVVVVGNITVGGTGKSPMIAYLASLLKEAGYKPGIITRGYGRQSDEMTLVTSESTPQLVGDEAVMLFQKTQCPVMVGANRSKAGQALISSQDIDIILSDDGLQHESLGRDIEIIILDGQRGLGNGYCLPIGPLRESARRLSEVDFVLSNGQSESISHDFQFSLILQKATSKAEIQSLELFKGKQVHAIAGIGNPKRFFKSLVSHGLRVIEHPFPDHYEYQSSDFKFSDNLPVLLTEKDAVKCPHIHQAGYWVIPAEVSIDSQFDVQFLKKLEEVLRGQKTTRYTSLPNL